MKNDFLNGKFIFHQQQNRHNLAATMHLPEEKTDKLIIITHSFKGHKDYQPILQNFSVQAENEGYATLRFDCYGSGKSDGSFEESSITTQTRDLEDVICHAESSFSRICLAGKTPEDIEYSYYKCSNCGLSLGVRIPKKLPENTI